MRLTSHEPSKALHPAWSPASGGALAEDFRLGDIASPLRVLWQSVFPPVEVREDDEHYFVVAELPGFAPEDIDVTVDGDILSITGERQQSAEVSGPTVSYSDRPSGAFVRRLTLPNIEAGEVAEARMENGLLNIKVQKAEQGRRRRITVNAR